MGDKDDKPQVPVEPKEQPPKTDWVETEEVRKDNSREGRETK